MDVPRERRLRVQPAAARAAALLHDGRDLRRLRRHRLHGAARPRAHGHADGAPPLPAPRPARARRRIRRRRTARLRPVVPVLLSLRARGHLLRGGHLRAGGRHLPLPRPAAGPPAGADRRPAGRQLRGQGDDVHHRLRRLHVSRARADLAVAPAGARPDPGRGPRGVGLGAGRLPRRLHPALHDVPHQPRRRPRPLHRARILARPARGRARRRGVELLRRGPLRRGVAGAAARRGRRCGLAPAPDAAAPVPDLGLPALADHLLVGGREVRLARVASAAAAAAPGRRRRAGDLGQPPALVRQARRRRGGGGVRLRRLRLVPRQCGAPRGPARAARLDADLRGGQARGRRGRRAGGAAADLDHRRLLRGRDLPVGVVLPRPPRQLPRARRGFHGARAGLGRADPHRRRARPPRPAAPGPRRARVPVPRLVGARLRRDVTRGLVALVHASASRGARRAACPSGSTSARALGARPTGHSV